MSDRDQNNRNRLVDRFGRPISAPQEKNFAEKAERNWRRISATIIGVSALVGAIVALLANFDTLCERFCPPGPEPVPDLEAFLAVDYWRMAGAYEVPFFLLEGPNIARCDDPNALGINRANCDYSDDIGEVWRTELSDTLLVDDGLLDQSNIFSGLREIWFSSTGPEVVDAIYCSIMSMDGGIELQLDPNRALSRDTIETYL